MRKTLGFVSPEQLAVLVALEHDRDQLEGRVKSRKAALKEEVVQKLRKEFELEDNALQARHKLIWDEIARDFSLTAEADVSVDPETRELYLKEEPPEFNLIEALKAAFGPEQVIELPEPSRLPKGSTPVQH